MRKAAVMIGFGAFFLAMALLMRFYAYPKLAVIPQDQNTVSMVEDPDAHYFDAPTVAASHGPIVTKNVVVADKKKSEEVSKKLKKDVVVLTQWQTTSTVKDGKATTPPMDASTRTLAVDASTGAAVDWDGNTADGKRVNISGQVVKFPFQVKKNDSYEYYDSTLGKPFAMKYVGEEKVDGLNTYKFVQHVPRTKFTEMDVPGEIFGKPAGGVTADRYYENDRTIWVEPETGVMMKVQEKQHQELEIPDASPVNAMTTTSVMTPETVKDNVDEYKTKSVQLKILRLWAPIILGVLGLIAIVVGILISVRSGSGRRDERGSHEGTYTDDVAPGSRRVENGYNEHRYNGAGA